MLIGDMNVRVGSNKIAGMVGRWGVDGRNQNWDCLLSAQPHPHVYM